MLAGLDLELDSVRLKAADYFHVLEGESDVVVPYVFGLVGEELDVGAVFFVEVLLYHNIA